MVESLLWNYQYALLFLGLVLGGETLLVPAVYFAQFGGLNLWYVTLIALAATLISDLVWYLLGRYIPKDRLLAFYPIRKYQKTILGLSQRFEERGLVILFASKFVYGTRIATQVLCGIYKMNVVRYGVVNALGVAVWIGALVALANIFRSSIAVFSDAISVFVVAFTGFVVILIAIHLLFRKLLATKWFQQ